MWEEGLRPEVRWPCSDEGIGTTKRLQQQNRDVLLDLPFFKFPCLCTWHLDALHTWGHYLLCEQQQPKHDTILARWHLHWFHQLGQMHCSLSVWSTKDNREMAISTVTISVHPFTWRVQNLPSPSSPERNSIIALGQKEKMSYQHTTFFDSFSICICISINFKSERQ